MDTKNKNIIPIFFAVNDDYVPLLHVAIESIMSQASGEYHYHIHILCDNLSEKNQRSLTGAARENFEIRVTDMRGRIEAFTRQMHLRDYYTRTIYFRVFIADIFPEYEKALYLDCDTVLNADISELYSFDIADNYVGAITCETVDSVPEFTAYAENFLGLKLPQYFNSGILVMNLAVMRSVCFFDRFFDIADKVEFFVAPDQDYFNVLCQGHVKFIPEVRRFTWNKTPRPENDVELKDVKLVHYNLAYRPWRYDGVLYEELFWKHAKNTPVYHELLERKRNFSEKDAEYDRMWMKKLVRLATELSAAEESVRSKINSGKIVLMG